MKKLGLITLLALLAFACNKKTNFVEITTDYGVIVIELYDETPLHRDNFQKLVADGFYNDLLFHRVINEFMVQGGDPASKDAEAGAPLGSGGPGYKVAGEFNKSDRCYHKKGALAAAREGDQSNPERKSSGSQFYIVMGRPYSKGELNQMERQKVNQARQRYFNLESVEMMDTLQILNEQGKTHEVSQIQQEILATVDQKIEAERELYYMTDEQKETYASAGGTPHLDGAYTVFGQVIVGQNVVDNIAKAKANRQNRPNKDIKMSMKFVQQPK